MNQTTEKPKIVFPCADYLIKVMGPATADFKDVVLKIVKLHDPQHDGSVTVRESSKGRFLAISVRILAVNNAQLKALYSDLRASGQVTAII
ncbi:MAG: DUF493 domain-containing protein [Endozoicomonadaceae bacterium]|nr:DUF493 domain-containing protein [Endozoicomonadaceae bacterium]